MFVQLLTSFLLVIPIGSVTDLQATPQAVTGNAPATLSSAEISDLQKKADSGDAAAQFALGKAYESGNGVPKRTDQATLWYRKAADQGNQKAQSNLGLLYWLGDGVEQDKAEAVRWYRKAARQGDANAMFNLGAAYYNGEGIGLNDTLAYAWFLLSSEAGNSSGQDAANRSRGEHGVVGFADACIAIGQMFEKGEDLPKNLESAAAWYRKAAEHGYGEAQLDLAALYINASDYNQARPWCEAAAKKQFAGGFYCLGYLYQHGFGVNPNPKQAFGLYEQGARGGNISSMRALARMYENGEGTKPDHVQALNWFLLAAERGNQSAIADLKRMRSSMTDKEWTDTEKKLPPNFDRKRIDNFLQGTN
ncbi:MAG: tetratricopeptide repeat protein [Terriglobales bacterium]|jgi:TPR repeat protein